MTDIAAHIPKNLAKILKDVIEQFKTELRVEAIILTGSYARGDFTKYSDVDITVFYDKLESKDKPLYDLNYISNYLISTSKSTIIEWKEKLTIPQELFNIYFAIKDSIILFDRNIKFHQLQIELDQDPWSQLETERIEAINYELKGYVEEVYKLLRGIEDGDKSLISFALFGLLHGISIIVAMHQRLLITTENQLYRELQSTVGKASKWSRLFRESLGMDEKTGSNITERGKSGLKLFLETLEIITLSLEVANFVLIPIQMIKQILRDD